MRKFRHDISIIPPKDVRFSGKSLSEYELILALIEKVNELIKYTNSVAELVYALEKWINDEFINAIDESTKKTLIEWRESGYLQELVEDYLVNLTVATSELLDEDEQKFKSGWHPVLDTKLSVDKAPEEVFDENYCQTEVSVDNLISAGPYIRERHEFGYIVSITSNASDSVNNINNALNLDGLDFNIGDKIYARTSYVVNETSNITQATLQLMGVRNIDTKSEGFLNNESFFLSGVTTIGSVSPSGLNARVSFKDRNSLEDVDVYFYNYIFINLTKIFGEGNEPSKEWCDENLKYYPNWQDLTDEEKPYTVMTLEKGSSDDLFLISKIQESNLQNHDSKVVLRNVGQPFIIKDSVSGKYVEVPKKQSLDPNADGVPFNEYNLRNVFANITLSLHPDNTDGKIMVALDKSSIMHKVNLDEGFIWLVSRIDKLEDDMIVFEKWVKEYVSTKIVELEETVNEKINETIKYVDGEIETVKDDVDKNMASFKKDVEKVVNDFKVEVNESLLYIKNSIATYIYPSELDDDLFRLNEILQPNGVYVFKKGEYRVGGDVEIPSNCEITFESGAYVKRLPTERNVYRVFKVADVENVILNNLHIIGDRKEHLVNTGDGQGTCLAILNSKYVTVNGGKFISSWGDGIYIGHEYYGDSKTETEHVYINDVYIDDAQRNGISLCGGNVIHVRGGEIKNTVGKSPEAGIDIEPEGKGGVKPFVNNVVIDGVYLHGNEQRAFAVNLNQQEEREGNVIIKNCNATNSRIFSTVNGSSKNFNSIVMFQGNTGQNFRRGVFSVYHDYRGLQLKIVDNVFKEYMTVPENDPRYDAGICIYNNDYPDKYLGNVFAKNNIFTSTRKRDDINAISIGSKSDYNGVRNVEVIGNRLWGRVRYGDQPMGIPSIDMKDNNLTTLNTTGNATITTVNFYEKVIFQSGSTSNLSCSIPKLLPNMSIEIYNTSRVYVDCTFDFTLNIDGESKSTLRLSDNTFLKIVNVNGRYIGQYIR